MLLSFGFAALPAAETASKVNPALDPDWTIQLRGRKSAAGKMLTIKTPAVPDVYAYVPVFKFELKLKGQNNKNIMPVLTVNNKPLPEFDRWDAQRLLNRKNSSDGGSGVYMYNLAGMLRNGKYNRIQIQLNDKSAAYTISQPEVFLKAENRSVLADAPAKVKNVFKIAQTSPLKVTLNGEEFISGESYEYRTPMEKLANITCKELKNSAGEVVAHNMFRLKDPQFDFRREISLNDKGELTLTFRHAPKTSAKLKEGYGLRVPLKFFDGAEYEIQLTVFKRVTGKLNIAEIRKGKSIFTDPKTKASYNNIRYLQLKKGDLKVNFDFAPSAGSGSPYCNSPAQYLRQIIRVDDDMMFVVPKNREGDRTTYLMRIFCGENDYFYRNGTVASSRWSSGPHCTNLGYSISFADRAETLRRNSQLLTIHPGWHRDYMMPFKSSTAFKELPGVLPGWRKLPAGYAHFGKGPFFPVAAGMTLADGKVSEFVVPLQSGFYLVGLIAGDFRSDVGPFTVKFNGETAFKDVKIKAGHYRQLAAYIFVRAPEKEMRIEFEGKNISLNQLIVRPDMLQDRDYVLTKGYWAAEGLPEFGFSADPGEVLQRKKDTVPAVMGADVLPEVAAVAMKLSDQETKYPEPSKAPEPEQNQKIWNAAWTDMIFTTGNRDSGFTDLSDEYFEKHFAGLKKIGINGVTEEGLFWYNVYDDATKIAHGKRQRRINDIAHKYGIDIVRHADNPCFTLLNSVGNLAKYPGAFMSDASSLRIVRALYCLNNPKFRKDSIENLVRYIKMTDCDVMMVDDQHGTFNAYRCFCAYCREAFTRDTGCILPMPDQMNEFYKPDNPLRARWQEWMQYQEGAYLNELRAAAVKVKPSIKFTNYGVDFRLANGHLHGIAPYLDVFGIEVAANDLYSLHAYFYMAYRKLINALGEAYDRPTWLLFSDRKDLNDPKLRRYFCWAVATMARSGVDYFGWTMSYDNMVPKWPDQMDLRYKKGLADIAIFNRPDGRYNFELGTFKNAPLYEQNGISQLLQKAFVPHEFITEKALEKPAELAKWKLIIIGDTEIFSDKELNVLKKYVADGGKLIITGRFAGLDTLYRKQPDGRFAEVSGVLHQFGSLHDSEKFTTSQKQLFPAAESIKLTNKSAQVIASFPDGTPAVTAHKYGKGLCVVSALAIGRKNTELPHIKSFKLGNKWIWKDVPEAGEFVRFLLQTAGTTQFPYTVATREKDVIVEGCADTKGSNVYFQVLRIPPRNVKFGAVTKPFPTTFEQLQPAANPITITVPFKVKAAFATSPNDFTGRQALSVRELSDGGSEIILPGKLLKVYNQITVER